DYAITRLRVGLPKKSQQCRVFDWHGQLKN
ncbi:MAG: hypothetical protein ACI814_005054, partial [Mariniblastus sp.]